ncbi:ABC transporter substrate-binding protein [Donghicola sp. C2-DW-16]|uniref:ABC transporter substrate-binding protein n=1 Tax=Donghicola mangrovi TaxID=2729614 RepID=A0ABX2PEW4_9RHOB|nr:ABC transporter substrate-binding protein [Donghicola mangrovi]NVO28035.1 ABC transporter substrate-binding protein [Donghicola mangrovi]
MRWLALIALLPTGVAAQETPRVLSLGGAVTEIVYALGAGEALVGRDQTSTYPAQAEALPDVGYVRRLSPEGILSVEPTLILAEAGAGPVETVTLMEGAGVPWVTIPGGYDADTVPAKVNAVANALGLQEQGDALAAELAQQLADAQAATPDQPLKVMFVMSLQAGRVMAAGQDTAANGMITLAGAQNAITSFDGYKQLTDEAILTAAPDVILMMARAGEHAVTNADLRAHPALGATPAAQNEAVIRMDGMYLLGFGPRTPEAIRDLSARLSALQPEAG